MEENSVRKLTLKDFEDIEVNPNWFGLDFLAVVASRALTILNREEKIKNKEEEDKPKEKLSDVDSVKLKRKVPDSDQLDGQPKKKIHTVEEKGREILQPRFSEGMCVEKELSEMEITSEGDKTKEPTLSKGVVMSRIINKKHQECKKNKEDSLLCCKKNLKKERILRKKPVDNDESYQECKEESKNKKKLQREEMDNGPSPPPPLPTEFREALEQLAQGKPITELNLLLQKGLYKTDISSYQNRLSLPVKDLLCSPTTFLREDEIERLKSYVGKNVYSMKADIIEPSLEIGDVDLRRWVMRKNSGNESVSYVLARTWNRMVKKHSIQRRDVLQVWSVRVDEKLCFLLVNVSRGGCPNAADDEEEQEQKVRLSSSSEPEPSKSPKPSTTSSNLVSNPSRSSVISSNPDSNQYYGQDQ